MPKSSGTYDYGHVEQFPALTFHYGLSFMELVSMPHVFRKLYIDALPELLAARQLQSIEAATYPHTKTESQRKLLRQIQRDLDRRKTRASTPHAIPNDSPVLMHQQLGAIGVGVTFVGANGSELKAEHDVAESEVNDA